MKVIVFLLFFVFLFNFFSENPNLDLMIGILVFTIIEHLKEKMKL